MLTDKQIEDYLEDMESKLTKTQSRERPLLTKDWVERQPSGSGVYVAFENHQIVYVGETGDIRGRMGDLMDTRNHTLRRSIGRVNFSNEDGYNEATTSRKFPSHVEEKVDSWLKLSIEIAVLPMKLGRKELEEKIYRKYKPKYNQKGQRKSA